jgi:uncharacterized protein (TIGR04141 family)
VLTVDHSPIPNRHETRDLEAPLQGMQPDSQSAHRRSGGRRAQLAAGKTPGQPVKDLDVLDEILHATPPLPELAVLEQLVALKDPEIIDRLEQALDEALGSPDGKRLGLSRPHEQIDENGTPTSFKVYGLGHQAAAPQDGLPALETFLEPLADAAAGERVERQDNVPADVPGGLRRCRSPRISTRSRHSRRSVPTNRSA